MTWSEITVPVTCVGCSKLARCKRVTARMIAQDEACELYAVATSGELVARLRILDKHGPHALLPNPNPRIKPDEKVLPMAIAVPRVLLRKLALASGVLVKDPTIFDLLPEELLKALEPTYEDIRGLNINAVKELTAEAENDYAGEGEEEKVPKTAAKKPTRRRSTRSKAKVEEAEEEAEEEAPVKKTRRRGRAAAKADEPQKTATRRGRRGAAKKDNEAHVEADKTTRRRGRAARKNDEKPAETETEAAGSVDLQPVLDRLDAIGGEVDKVSKKVASKAEKKDVADLAIRIVGAHEKLALIENGLIELFNMVAGEFDEDGIDSLEDLEEGEGN